MKIIGLLFLLNKIKIGMHNNISNAKKDKILQIFKDLHHYRSLNIKK